MCFPPKLPTAVLPRRLGGLVNTGPLSFRHRPGWSAIEEHGAPRTATPCFLPRAFPHPRKPVGQAYSLSGFAFSVCSILCAQGLWFRWFQCERLEKQTGYKPVLLEPCIHLK